MISCQLPQTQLINLVIYNNMIEISEHVACVFEISFILMESL